MYQRELHDPRVLAERRFVGQRDEPFARRDRLGAPPQRRHRDAIDAVAPGVPLLEHWLEPALGLLHLCELARGERAHALERRLRECELFFRKRACEVALQHAIVRILVAEARRGLDEAHAQARKENSIRPTRCARCAILARS